MLVRQRYVIARGIFGNTWFVMVYSDYTMFNVAHMACGLVPLWWQTRGATFSAVDFSVERSCKSKSRRRGALAGGSSFKSVSTTDSIVVPDTNSNRINAWPDVYIVTPT